LTKRYAQELIETKERREAEKERNKEARMLQQMVRKEAKELKSQGIIARRCERSRKKALQEVIQGDIGAGHLYIEVPDPEKEARLQLPGPQLPGLQLPRT
jgi:superfamily II DNA or RNA helicase